MPPVRENSQLRKLRELEAQMAIYERLLAELRVTQEQIMGDLLATRASAEDLRRQALLLNIPLPAKSPDAQPTKET
jgi:ParB-like chromosome segregation protein Spo0J